MEMFEEIYANAEVTEDKRADSRDSKNSYEDVYANQDNLETQKTRNFKESENSAPSRCLAPDDTTAVASGMDHAGNKWYILPAVCVVTLCVLLLTAITVLWIKLNNMTTDRDQLQTSYNNLNVSRDQLQTSYNALTTKKDQLQTSFNTLTTKKDQLQTSYNSLSKERDQIQTSYNSLSKERDQLQTSYDSLSKERDQLQTSYNALTTKKDQLQTSYDSLIKERDQLQKQKDELQKNVNNLVGWIFFTSKLYYISSEKKSWPESRQDCRNRGLDLIVINSKEEQEFVEKLSRSKNYGVYIGLTDLDTERVWKWVDGTSMTTAYWSSRNGFSDSEDCVVNRYDGTDQWFDRPCTETYYWICE